MCTFILVDMVTVFFFNIFSEKYLMKVLSF